MQQVTAASAKAQTLTEVSLVLYILDRCFASWGESEQAEGLGVMQHLLLCKLKAVITTLIHNPSLYAHALLHIDVVDSERDKCPLSLCE